MNYIALFVGGLIGGLLRYGIETFLPSPPDFPLSTLLINLFGAFVLGLFYRLADVRPVQPWLRLGFGTGLIGAFTTFSTLCMETSDLLQTSVFLAGVYGVLSMAGGPTFALLGDNTPDFISRLVMRLSTAPETPEERP